MDNLKISVGLVVGFILVVMIIVFAIGSITIVPSGYVGVKTHFGAVQEQQIYEGLNFKFPFVEDIKLMDCRTQRVDIEGEGASKDLQTVGTSIAVNYKVNGEMAHDLYKTVGMNYDAIIISPATQEAMKSALAQYTAEELITKRQEVANVLYVALKDRLEEKHIIVENINIINLVFSQAYNNAIESKQVAEQEAQKAKQELEKAKVDAEKKIVEAQAEAEALRVQKQEITDDLLQLRQIENEAKMIEKWDGKLPTYMTESAVPFLNLK